MPTGYTADIQKGISFEKYALNCAKAFGALIMMRDESSDAEIPQKFEPSDYHLKAKLEAMSKLTNLNSMSYNEIELAANESFKKAESCRMEWIEKEKATETSYLEMLEHCKRWESPSLDHDKLKDFMISQIEQSIKFDCGSEYYQIQTPKLTGDQWLSRAIEKAHESIAYHVKGYREEVDRTNGRNEWIDLLRNSLKDNSL